MQLEEIIENIKDGKVGIMPTDTIFGIVGKATSEEVANKICEAKNRDYNKSFIILISSKEDLNIFGIDLKKDQEEFLDTVWPGAVSVVFPVKDFEYLHRGTETLAFRLPNKKELIDLLKNTGPIIATSANIQGQEPVKNIQEAKDIFGDKIDFYVDGKTNSTPSKIIRFLEDGSVERLR